MITWWYDDMMIWWHDDIEYMREETDEQRLVAPSLLALKLVYLASVALFIYNNI